MSNIIIIKTIKTEEDIWFVEKLFNLFDFLDFFPEDAIGTADKEGTPLRIDTDLGWTFYTDIERGKFCFRKKSKSLQGTGKWVNESRLKIGESIILEKVTDYHYKLYKS